MPSWTATSRRPGHIPSKPTILDGRSNPKVTAQVEVAHTAAKKMAAVVGEESLVSMAGHVQGRQDNVPNQIHIDVVEAEV